MGGVDHSDQMVNYAEYSGRTLKWWKRVLFHMVNLAVLNAYLLYKDHVGEANAMLHREFRKKLVRGMIESVEAENVPHGP